MTDMPAGASTADMPAGASTADMPACARAGLHTPAMLVILDGFGIAPASAGNAVSLASMPYFDSLVASCPHTTLAASGPDVGLPEGQMGNSEVGHLNIGSGRIVHQELSRINNAIADGSILDNEVLCNAIDGAEADGRIVHVMGLLSQGGVHSELSHIEAALEMAAARGASTIRLHAFMDGRDVSPTSGKGYIEQADAFLAKLMEKYGCDARIGVISGRFYAMDRDMRMNRVEKAWRALVLGEKAQGAIGSAGSACAADGLTPEAIMDASYAAGVTDEFVVPTIADSTYDGMHDGDAVIFCNFRPDRAREITRALVDPDFSGFERPAFPSLRYVCFTEYDPTIPAAVAFPKTTPEHVLADYLSELGLRQFHIAETEKYAHVTFFFNGGVEKPKEGEERCLIPSPKEVPTYDLKPQMSAPEVAESLTEAIRADKADVYIVNFANCDMVGHTGKLPAAIAAVEAADAALGKVVDALLDKGGVALVTADHGNAEAMLAEDGSPHTAHTTNRVPLVLVGGEGATFIPDDGQGRLADIAPTLVKLIGLEQPSEWTGHCLLA